MKNQLNIYAVTITLSKVANLFCVRAENITDLQKLEELTLKKTLMWFGLLVSLFKLIHYKTHQ